MRISKEKKNTNTVNRTITKEEAVKTLDFLLGALEREVRKND